MEELLASGLHWRIVNFILFVGLLVYVLRKPAKAFWESRAQRIHSEIEQGEQLRREAEGKYRTLEKRFLNLETEIQGLVSSMQREGSDEKKFLLSDAEALAARIRKESERIAAQEVRKARESLRAQAVTLAVELAEKMIRQGLGEEDQKRLADKYLSALEESPQ